MEDSDTTKIGDTITCSRCKQDYRYHGLIVCDSCHAEVNRLEDQRQHQHDGMDYWRDAERERYL